MEVGMKICILIPHLYMVPLSRVHTQVARSASERRQLLFWNPFLPKAAALCAKHNSTGDALNSSEISAVPHLRCEQTHNL